MCSADCLCVIAGDLVTSSSSLGQRHVELQVHRSDGDVSRIIDELGDDAGLASSISFYGDNGPNTLTILSPSAPDGLLPSNAEPVNQVTDCDFLSA